MKIRVNPWLFLTIFFANYLSNKKVSKNTRKALAELVEAEAALQILACGLEPTQPSTGSGIVFKFYEFSRFKGKNLLIRVILFSRILTRFDLSNSKMFFKDIVTEIIIGNEIDDRQA